MLEEFISKIQYLIGDYGYNFLCSSNQRYSNPKFQTVLELEILLEYLTSDDIVNKDPQELAQLIDFFEARYNFNNIPYIEYPFRVTNILTGYGTSESDIIFSGVGEAPYNNDLHARINGQWQSFLIPDSYTQSESDLLYYPLNSNPAEYLTSVDLHDPVTISTLGVTNGLSIVDQVLSLKVATQSLNGVLSASDKTKLDNLIIQDPVTLGTVNGLELDDQELSLNLATTSNAGAMSASDKTKLNSLSNYTHPTGFSNQPTSPLANASVISRILVNNEGHVTGVDSRNLTLANLGLTPSALTKVDDTNITLTLGGTPSTSLLQSVSITAGWNGLLSVIRGGTGAGSHTSGEVLIGNGTSPITSLPRLGIDTRTSFPPSSHNLNSHSDVNLTVPTIGQVLGWNGTVFTNLTLELDDFDFDEIDPIFTAFRDASRTANTFYSAPNGSNGIALFRAISTDDIPNVYLRYDIQQTLTEIQKQRVITALGITSSTGSYEPAFNKGDVDTTTDILTITNGEERIVGIADLIIDHNTSGWIDKTTLATDQIIANITVDEYGHIADWTTRTLTLDDITSVGYQASIDAMLLLSSDLEEAIYEINQIKITRPVHKHYTSTSEMIDGQGCNCQLEGFLYFDGTSYWEYLGTTNGDITDYRIISSSGGSTDVHNELTGLQGGDGTNYNHLGNTDYAAITNANAPTALNPFATIADIPTLIDQHNDLSGLQGGEAGEYYHLNETHYDAVINSNLASETNPYATIDDLLVISGTENYLSKFNSTGDNIIDSLIFDNGTNVGIGTTNFTDPAALVISGRISQTNLGTSLLIGYQAGLNDDLTTNGNTVIGYQAATANVTGSNSLIAGKQAAFSIATINNSIILGANANPLATAQTNQIVIGYNTTGNGSNTVTIGNSSITKNYLSGTVQHAAAILPTESVILSQLTDAISGIPSTYVHPTYTPIDETLSGATVIATIETDSIGSVVDLTTRELTLSDLGYIGDYESIEQNFTYSSGDFEFTLSDTPDFDKHIHVSVNGQSLTTPIHYTISGTTLTLLVDLEVGYLVNIKYEIL